MATPAKPPSTAVSAPAPAKPEAKSVDTVEACESLIAAYAISRDNRDAATYATLFADDAEFVFGQNAVKGKAAIVALMQERSRDVITRHLMTTVSVRPVDESTAEGTSYFVVFSEPPFKKKNDRPIPTSGPSAVIEYHDRFRQTDEGWKFARREVRLVYVYQR